MFLNLLGNLNSHWSLEPLVQGPFCFWYFCPKRVGSKENKVNFFRVFDNSLSKYFKKNFLHTMAVLGYLLKWKRHIGIAFGEHFLQDFPWKDFLFNTPSTDKVSMPQLFFFWRYQTKCVIKILFRQLMTS